MLLVNTAVASVFSHWVAYGNTAMLPQACMFTARMHRLHLQNDLEQRRNLAGHAVRMMRFTVLNSSEEFARTRSLAYVL